jgi:hypothetical protein
MTCYKLVTVEFKWFGLQGAVEKFIQGVRAIDYRRIAVDRPKVEHKLFFSFYRELFCTIDQWHGMTIEQIRHLEEETKAKLDHVCCMHMSCMHP